MAGCLKIRRTGLWTAAPSVPARYSQGKCADFSVNVDDRANISSRQESKIVCHQITCPPVACASPSFLDGECCPVCLREYFRLFFSSAFIHLKKLILNVCLHCYQRWTVTMAGPPGRSGQSALSPAVQELSKGGAHATQPVTPAPALPSRLASAAWSNAIAVVRSFFFFFLISFPVFQFPFSFKGAPVTSQLPYYLEQRRPLS